MSVRVRFAPSPTGYLHVGGARTALFNFLYARRQGGTFILRIEDTDVKRSSEEMVSQILESMNWLGLKPDEGPYFQSRRLEIYKRHLEELIDRGHVYPCGLSPKEFSKEREQAIRTGDWETFRRKCQRAKPHRVWVFKVEPNQRVVVRDLIRGEVEFDTSEIGDQVVWKADGTPTYNFAVVVDDHDMGITHVIRGEDHLPNTPKQILLYRAFGWKPPKFAHVSMILGPDGQKLSKRHGATAVSEFRKLGIIPEAMVNYLALLGWSHPSGKEVLTTEEIISAFSIKRVSKNPAIFDYKKLEWINSQHIKMCPKGKLYEYARPFFERAGFRAEREYLEDVLEILKGRMKTLCQLREYADYFFKDPDLNALPQDAKEILKYPYSLQYLERMAQVLGSATYTKDELLRLARENVPEGADRRTVIQALRVALTGKTVTPDLFDVMALIQGRFGTETIVRRVKNAVSFIKEVLAR